MQLSWSPQCEALFLDENDFAAVSVALPDFGSPQCIWTKQGVSARGSVGLTTQRQTAAFFLNAKDLNANSGPEKGL